MKCDKVDAEVEIKEDGTWHIIKILGRNKAAYAKKKAWEKQMKWLVWILLGLIVIGLGLFVAYFWIMAGVGLG